MEAGETRATIRELRATDWRAFREIRLRALAESPDAFQQTLAGASAWPDAQWEELVAGVAASPTHALFIAERAGRAIGVVYARLESERPEIAHLGAMWIDPDARRAGVGRLVVDAVLDWARARNAKRVELQVTEGNGRAERLYARAGFARTEKTAALRPGAAPRVRTMGRSLGESAP
ncbi:MAG: GNAT family N-acetyltransferase [Deltaproteobacteria bacterium]|nr:GNAT family N-acetyltransferase [Deltaproteobacteria bacterium]